MSVPLLSSANSADLSLLSPPELTTVGAAAGGGGGGGGGPGVGELGRPPGDGFAAVTGAATPPWKRLMNF